jgi:hypothetical protein
MSLYTVDTGTKFKVFRIKFIFNFKGTLTPKKCFKNIWEVCLIP